MATRFHHRAADGPADLEKVRAFIVDLWRGRGVLCTLHIGDLYWRLHRNETYSLTERVHLWEDEAGQLLAFALFDPPASCDMLVHPDWRSGDLERDQLAWIEAAARKWCERAGTIPEITVGSLDGDPRRLALLVQRGYGKQSSSSLHLWRPLDEPIADPQPPPHYVCRGLAGEVEVEDRVALHRAAFPASRLTVDSYRRLLGCPAYDPQLDVVALDYDGRMAAFCLGWLDAENRVGQVEPMGCHPRFRRRGLGRAVLLEALHRLHGRGAQVAVLFPSNRNAAALVLYESCGFRVALTDWEYTLPLC